MIGKSLAYTLAVGILLIYLYIPMLLLMAFIAILDGDGNIFAIIGVSIALAMVIWGQAGTLLRALGYHGPNDLQSHSLRSLSGRHTAYFAYFREEE